MAANEPHAYVAGEIIECMACSDNVVRFDLRSFIHFSIPCVQRFLLLAHACTHSNPFLVTCPYQVRAGLTPKFKDIDNLVDMLTYSMGGPSIDAGAYSADNPDVIRYTPPCPEFEVMILNVEPGKASTYKNPGIPVIMIILEGSGYLDGKLCRPGRSYYWPANADDLLFTVDSSRRGAMKVALAHKNLHLDRPTAVNREDFGGASSRSVLSVPVSPRMPYMGIGGSTPLNQDRKLMDLESKTKSMEPELPLI